MLPDRGEVNGKIISSIPHNDRFGFVVRDIIAVFFDRRWSAIIANVAIVPCHTRISSVSWNRAGPCCKKSPCSGSIRRRTVGCSFDAVQCAAKRVARVA